VRVDVAVERVGQRRRAERRSADADHQQRVGVRERFDRRPDRVGVGRVRQVQCGVAVIVVRATPLDSLVGRGDVYVQPLQGLAGDAR